MSNVTTFVILLMALTNICMYSCISFVHNIMSKVWQLTSVLYYIQQIVVLGLHYYEINFVYTFFVVRECTHTHSDTTTISYSYILQLHNETLL